MVSEYRLITTVISFKSKDVGNLLVHRQLLILKREAKDTHTLDSVVFLEPNPTKRGRSER